MIATDFATTRDPRSAARDDSLTQASIRAAPEVGRPATAAEGMGLAIGIIGAALVGGLTIVSLARHHEAKVALALTPPPVAATAQGPLPPVQLVSTPALPVTSLSAPVATVPAGPHATPILVLDNDLTPAAAAHGKDAAPAPAAAGAARTDNFSPDEQFAARAGQEPVPTARVTHIDHPSDIVTQGTIIPAVLETALNSDLPGYARALVSRDVRSFNGAKVLIPRGSRLIGQYKSSLQAGQTRALVVWNRLLRPDGSSIQLGSPTADDIGEAGLAGKVNSHFFQRFGTAILLSVVDGLAGSLGNGSGNTVVLGSVGGGSGAAGVALQNQIKIAPTVRVAQGTPIQVFTARDLDFSGAGQ